MSVNRVILVGNVGADPEIRYVDSRPVAEFRLATSEPAYQTAAGVKMPERVEWHRIVTWDRTADFVEKYVRRGTKLYIEGKLRTRVWEDRNAIKRSVTEIYVDKLDLLGRSSND
ncbi:MAG: single-stranded DNA-binding protein [Clostridium sp.]|nr:single-stranded DNA-binding protein [Clostridium sp.]